MIWVFVVFAALGMTWTVVGAAAIALLVLDARRCRAAQRERAGTAPVPYTLTSEADQDVREFLVEEFRRQLEDM